MVSTYNDVSKEEFLRQLIKYSVPLFERQAKDEEEQGELEDLVRQNQIDVNSPANLVYADNYQQQRLSAGYSSTIGAYLDRRLEALQDFSDRVPGKHIVPFPQSIFGLLGYTYIGDNRMGRREDLIGDHETDVHECIHTPDEYETRLLTSWIMSREKPTYVK